MNNYTKGYNYYKNRAGSEIANRTEKEYLQVGLMFAVAILLIAFFG